MIWYFQNLGHILVLSNMTVIFATWKRWGGLWCLLLLPDNPDKQDVQRTSELACSMGCGTPENEQLGQVILKSRTQMTHASFWACCELSNFCNKRWMDFAENVFFCCTRHVMFLNAFCALSLVFMSPRLAYCSTICWKVELFWNSVQKVNGSYPAISGSKLVVKSSKKDLQCSRNVSYRHSFPSILTS